MIVGAVRGPITHRIGEPFPSARPTNGCWNS
jgi:hypothetical protein